MASDYLLEIDGIKGESQEQGHEGAIELDSFSWGVSNHGSMSHGGGGGAGKANFQDLHFTCKSSKASPSLKTSCATGKHFPKATILCRLGGPPVDPGAPPPAAYLQITMTDCMVSSYQVAAGDVNGDGRADIIVVSDQVSINFKSHTFVHIPPPTP